MLIHHELKPDVQSYNLANLVISMYCNFIKRYEEEECFRLEKAIPLDITMALKKNRNHDYSGHKDKLKSWREINPEKWAERNKKIAESRKGKKFKNGQTQKTKEI